MQPPPLATAASPSILHLATVATAARLAGMQQYGDQCQQQSHGAPHSATAVQTAGSFPSPSSMVTAHGILPVRLCNSRQPLKTGPSYAQAHRCRCPCSQSWAMQCRTRRGHGHAAARTHAPSATNYGWLRVAPLTRRRAHSRLHIPGTSRTSA